MANSRNGRLPPKSPFPPSKSDYISIGGPKNHQRASSESLVIEEQPCWVDQLLNEPETPPPLPLHRRSSSDSDTHVPYFYQHQNPINNLLLRRSLSLGIASTTSENQDANTCSHNNAFTSEADSKRTKQQFAQRSRVRKLQYIAELERNVQALQAEGSEVSAELEFLNQQSLILGMENQALKQRLENLAQEQLIKCLEHEVLEREMGRLRVLYQQQQQRPQQQPEIHRRTASHDRLDLHFANLSMKNKESNPVHDHVSSQPRN